MVQRSRYQRAEHGSKVKIPKSRAWFKGPDTKEQSMVQRSRYQRPEHDKSINPGQLEEAFPHTHEASLD